MKLTIRQSEALDILEDKTTNVLVFGGAASGGKSYLGCYWVLKQCIRYPNTRHLIGRSRLTTLKQSTLVTFFKVCKAQGLKVDIHYKYNAQSNEILFTNGSAVILKDLFQYPTDREFDSLGGLEITSAYIDEGQQIGSTAYNVVTSRLRHLLDEYGLIPKTLITCNPGKNFLYKDFYKKHMEGSLPENHKFIQSLVSDNPNVSESYIQILNELPKAQRDKLLLGRWDVDDVNQLITQTAIIEVFNNTWVKGGTMYLTGDIARMGSDKAVLGVWNGLRLIKVVSFAKSKFQLLESTIKELKDKYKISNTNIILDADGVGGFLVDAVKAKEFINNSKALNDEQYQNLKTQCYYKLANVINKRELYIEEDVFTVDEIDILIEELEQVQSSPTDDNKLKIISKSDVKANIGRSPDISDMLMMRMYFDLNPPLQKFKIR